MRNKLSQIIAAQFCSYNRFVHKSFFPGTCISSGYHSYAFRLIQCGFPPIPSHLCCANNAFVSLNAIHAVTKPMAGMCVCILFDSIFHVLYWRYKFCIHLMNKTATLFITWIVHVTHLLCIEKIDCHRPY